MESNEIVVSIVCEVFNHEQYLERCLQGFVMQKTNFKYEILIHDDASTDGSVDIIKKYVSEYPDLFKPIYQKENQFSKGVGIWRTIQFPRAKGKYIALCEGDDYWIDPLKLQKQVDVLETHPECVMVFNRILTFSQEKNAFIRGKQYNGKTGYVKNKDLILKGGLFVPTCSMLFRNKLITPLFSKSYIQNCHVGDYPLQILCAVIGKCYYLADEMSVYRVGNSSSWTGKQKRDDINKNLRGYKSELEMLVGFMKDYPTYKNIIRKRLNYYMNSMYRPKVSREEFKKLDDMVVNYKEYRTWIWRLDLELRKVPVRKIRQLYHGFRFFYSAYRIKH